MTGYDASCYPGTAKQLRFTGSDGTLNLSSSTPWLFRPADGITRITVTNYNPSVFLIDDVYSVYRKYSLIEETSTITLCALKVDSSMYGQMTNQIVVKQLSPADIAFSMNSGKTN